MLPNNKTTLSNDVTIEKLPEALLAKIFSYLPLKQRCRISAVCKQWLSVSRIPWTDVSYLNASSISNKKMNAILEKCPKIRHFVKARRDIELEENRQLLSAQLRSLRLYDVEFTFRGDEHRHKDRELFAALMSAFFDRLSMLEELVLQYVGPHRRDVEMPAFGAVVAALRRLKIVNLTSDDTKTPVDTIISFRQMAQLECLHLEGLVNLVLEPRALEDLWSDMAFLTNLRELCMAQVDLGRIYGGRITLKSLADFACRKTPQLEVLIYADDKSMEPEGVARLVTSHPCLRILVIAGEDRLRSETAPFIVPPRSLRSHRRSENVAPLLHVFVGGDILRTLRFSLREANTTKFWLIDCVMPKFLAKPQVAQVFEGVWLARMIREAAEVGSKDWIWGGSWGDEAFYTPTHPRAEPWPGGCWDLLGDTFHTLTRLWAGLWSRLRLWSRRENCWPEPVYQYEWPATVIGLATFATIGYVVYKGFAHQK